MCVPPGPESKTSAGRLPGLPHFSRSVWLAGKLCSRGSQVWGVLQVFMRLQWERQVVRGQSMRVEVALEGIGVSVMGGLQDELFNLTMDKIEVLQAHSPLASS